MTYGASLNGVDDDIPTWEQTVARPTTDERESSTAGSGIIFWVDIEETDFLDASTRGICGNGRDVDDAQAGAVVGLVDFSVRDVLVVVDGDTGGFEEAGLFGVLEVRDVPDVGDGVSVCGGARSINFIVFIIEDEVLLPFRV